MKESMPLHTNFTVLQLGYPHCLIEVEGEPVSRMVTPDELHERVQAIQEYEDNRIRDGKFYDKDGNEVGWYCYSYKKRRELNEAMNKYHAEMTMRLFDDGLFNVIRNSANVFKPPTTLEEVDEFMESLNERPFPTWPKDPRNV